MKDYTKEFIRTGEYRKHGPILEVVITVIFVLSLCVIVPIFVDISTCALVMLDIFMIFAMIPSIVWAYFMHRKCVVVDEKGITLNHVDCGCDDVVDLDRVFIPWSEINENCIHFDDILGDVSDMVKVYKYDNEHGRYYRVHPMLYVHRLEVLPQYAFLQSNSEMYYKVSDHGRVFDIHRNKVTEKNGKCYYPGASYEIGLIIKNPRKFIAAVNYFSGRKLLDPHDGVRKYDKAVEYWIDRNCLITFFIIVIVLIVVFLAFFTN